MFIDGLLNFYFIWSVVKQVLLVFLVLIFHSMFMKKKNVFSNAMLLSIKRLQYFVLSLSCHGCLLKNKFLCLFLGRPAFMYPPFFQWLYKTYIWQSLVLLVTLYMYLGKRPLNCSNISNQTKLILDYLYMHVKFWIWEKN